MKLLPLVVLIGVLPTMLAAPSAAQQTTQPAETAQAMSASERHNAILKALETPPDEALLKKALSDVGHLQVSFRSKPLSQYVESASIVNGQIVVTPTVALNRPEGGPAPQEWLDKLLDLARRGCVVTELKFGTAPAPAVRAERDRLLADADAKIRQGLLELAGKHPQLAKTNWGTLNEALEGKSPPGKIVLWAGHYQDDKTGTREQVQKQERYNVLVIVRPLEWPEPPGAWALRPMHANLALMGQTHASAGDPFLDAALKKLVADALAPLEILEDNVATGKPVAPTASAPTSQPGK